MEAIEAVSNLIANLGFPIFISLYLLHRMEKKLDDMIEAVEHLTLSIQALPRNSLTATENLL